LHDEGGDIFDEIFANRFDMRDDARQVAEFLLDFLDRLLDRDAGGFAVQRFQLVAPFFFPLRNLAHDLLELALEHFDFFLNFAPLFFRQSIEFGGRDHFAVARGRERKAHRRPDNENALLLRLVAQFGKQFRLAFLKILVDGAAPGLVFVAVKHGRQGGHQIVDQPFIAARKVSARPAGSSIATGLCVSLKLLT
jgi:hypothetical protein